MNHWEFWIDVGGTFTDCIARSPDDRLVPCKVLSSGITKGRVAEIAGTDRIIDPTRIGDPANFWTGYEVRFLDEHGDTVHVARVKSFRPNQGLLTLEQMLPPTVSAGTYYELGSGEEAPILAIRYVLGLPLNKPIPEVSVRLGTTRGTNALLERKGAKTAFITTKGFADVLLIGNQDRPRLFDLAIQKPEPLFQQVVEIDERIDVDGNVLREPDETVIRKSLSELKQTETESIAICLLHSFENSDHEQLVERIAREVGFSEISTSSKLSPLIKIVSRGDTTVMDAYLNPILRQYVATLRTGISAGSLKMMTSAGGLVDADRFVGKDSILSGPAGGVIGFSRVAQRAGFDKSIGFDMGGTSTDVSRFDGTYELEFETQKAGVRVVAPMLAIETVAAGGGSICDFDGVKLHVGPHSAGANPGPACYGRGGPLSVTDINLYLGRIIPSRFPFPLDTTAVEQRLQDLCRRIADSPLGKEYSPIELADGFCQIANANMVRAIRKISVAKGYDPADYVLVTFGGAGAQHACAIARLLGIHRILVHPYAGILSAYGIGLADIRRFREHAVLKPYSEQTLDELESLFGNLETQATDEVVAEGIAAERIQPPIRSLDMRYQGVESTINVVRPDDGDYAAKYETLHQQLYGYTHAGRSVEITVARVEVVGTTADPPDQTIEPIARKPAAIETTQTWFDGERHDTGIFLRDGLHPGDEITGPAIVCESTSTVLIEPNFTATITSRGEILIEEHRQETGVRGQETGDRRQKAGGKRQEAEGWEQKAGVLDSEHSTPHSPLATRHSPPDPVMLEIFNNLFASIAEQMGVTLQKTSFSTNVKERLDFSCAIFDPVGDLVVNAPHIPVHLGAMSETVKRIIKDNPDMQPGDVYVTNDPYRGGSHLPDVTIITPVHDDGGQQEAEGERSEAEGEKERGGEGENRVHNSELGDPRSIIRNPQSTLDHSPLDTRHSSLLFFTASRAHHAEIGGIVPGSMPPFSKNLAEEGVLIRNFKLVDAGVSRENELRELLLSGEFPTRSIHDNLADVSAQVAANNSGVAQLQELVSRYTLPVVQAYMQHIQNAAAKKMRMALAAIPDGEYKQTDHLDDGSPITVTVNIHGETATVDFTGTGPVIPTNLNANRAIVSAAVLYVFRCLINEDIPLNSGVLEPVEIILPECFLNPPEKDNPAECAAVVGGNVETSQRVVDTLLGALNVAAASQGTMNNLTFGDETFGYYETICGGSGATPNANGADAVHTHMTNTRLTDVEVIERRYPVRVQEFSIRRGSGGKGKHRGGDGIVRRIEFLKPLKVSILSERRGPYAPFGLAGGEPGALGCNSLQRASTGDKVEVLGGKVAIDIKPGDVLTIETPGAGGYGKLE